jgi:hypothetical protein
VADLAIENTIGEASIETRLAALNDNYQRLHGAHQFRSGCGKWINLMQMT